MPYAVLEKEIRSLPLYLQQDIESYALSVIEKYKNDSSAFQKRKNIADILDKLTGIISGSAQVSIEEIRSERLSEKYGV